MTARHRTDDTPTDELLQPTIRDELLTAATELEQTGQLTTLTPAVNAIIGPLAGIATARVAATALRDAVRLGDRLEQLHAELVPSSGRLIRAGAARLELGNNWGEDTALVVLSQKVLRDALKALVLVGLLRERHVEVPWGGSTESTVCGCGQPIPCRDAVLLTVPSREQM